MQVGGLDLPLYAPCGREFPRPCTPCPNTSHGRIPPPRAVRRLRPHQGTFIPPDVAECLKSVGAEFATADVVYDVAMVNTTLGQLGGIKVHGLDYAMLMAVANLNPEAVRVLDVGVLRAFSVGHSCDSILPPPPLMALGPVRIACSCLYDSSWMLSATDSVKKVHPMSEILGRHSCHEQGGHDTRPACCNGTLPTTQVPRTCPCPPPCSSRTPFPCPPTSCGRWGPDTCRPQ